MVPDYKSKKNRVQISSAPENRMICPSLGKSQTRIENRKLKIETILLFLNRSNPRKDSSFEVFEHRTTRSGNVGNLVGDVELGLHHARVVRVD